MDEGIQSTPALFSGGGAESVLNQLIHRPFVAGEPLETGDAGIRGMAVLG